MRERMKVRSRQIVRLPEFTQIALIDGKRIGRRKLELWEEAVFMISLDSSWKVIDECVAWREKVSTESVNVDRTSIEVDDKERN